MKGKTILEPTPPLRGAESPTGSFSLHGEGSNVGIRNSGICGIAFFPLLTVQDCDEARLGTTVPISNSAKRNLDFYGH